jgi:methyl-accepting chemotaxis protein
MAGEVAAASQEQSQGIQQVNTAVTQMDKVTQSNAANAEESAAAAEELNAQAKTLKAAVADLLRLVDGQGHQTTETASFKEQVLPPRILRLVRTDDARLPCPARVLGLGIHPDELQPNEQQQDQQVNA